MAFNPSGSTGYTDYAGIPDELGRYINPAVDPTRSLKQHTAFMVNKLNQQIQYGVDAAENPKKHVNKLQNNIVRFANPLDGELGKIYKAIENHINDTHAHRTKEDRHMMIFGTHKRLVDSLLSDAIASEPAGLKVLRDIGVPLGGGGGGGHNMSYPKKRSSGRKRKSSGRKKRRSY